jgi:hypothetical protein
VSKNFKDLSEAEILALAISNEETDGRIYADFAVRLRDRYPATAEIFKEMEAEEVLVWPVSLELLVDASQVAGFSSLNSLAS